MPPKIVIKLISTYSCGDGSGWGDCGWSCGIEERQSALETYADSVCLDTSLLLADASEFCAIEMQTEPIFFKIELMYKKRIILKIPCIFEMIMETRRI